MKSVFYVINSFAVKDDATGKLVGGNGAVVLFLNNRDDLSDNQQLEVAKRFPDYTEVVFVYPVPGEGRADFGMRYWSPQRLCEYSITGHPTIAAAYGMLNHRAELLIPRKDCYRLETKAGVVSLNINFEEKKVYMGQIEPVFQDVDDQDAQQIVEILGLTEKDISSPVKAVNMGLGYFIFRVKDVPTLMRMKRDLPRLVAMNQRYGLNGGAQPYALTESESYYLRTRNLDLRQPNAAGVWLEDSACGQGSASLMAYLTHYMGHPGSLVCMEQGVPEIPCCVEAFSLSNDSQNGGIFIGGQALQISEGIVEFDGC